MQTDEKPRLVRVTDPDELAEMSKDSLAAPYPYYHLGDIYCDAAELAKWRAGRVNEVRDE